MITTVFWDWNGTLVADVPLAVRVNNQVFGRHGLSPTDAAAYRRLFRFPVQDYYRDMGVADADFPVLAQEWTECYQAQFPGTPLAAGAMATLARLQAAGLRQVMLSATREDLLRGQLALYPGLRDYFERILGLGDIYAVSKVQRGLDFLREAGVPGGEAVFLGDTLHDAEAARAMGCRCLLIAGGHQCEATLARAGVPVLPGLPQAGDWILERTQP